MILSFFGAARSVTGSKHLLTLDSGKRVLLDCGMFQGIGASDTLNRDLLFDPSTIDCLILSHAHLDHSGLIPFVVRNGFRGKIFCTPATKDLTFLILEDSARIQEQELKNAAFDDPVLTKGVLYTRKDVSDTLTYFHTIPYNQEEWIDEDIQLLFTDAGHILGSSVVNLLIKKGRRKKRICFTGDLGRYSNRILNPPAPCPAADYILCESTYGNSIHQSIESSEKSLEAIIHKVCVERTGKLIIPAFSIGRTQELIYSLNRLAEEGRLPEIPVFVDSPMATYATEIIKQYPECLTIK